MKVTVACTSECTGRTNEIMYVMPYFILFTYLLIYLLVNAFKKRDMTTGPCPASFPKTGSKTLTQNQLSGSLMRMVINEMDRLQQGLCGVANNNSYHVSSTVPGTVLNTWIMLPALAHRSLSNPLTREDTEKRGSHSHQ